MKKRAFLLLLAFLATQAIGCWCCRPHLLRRMWWNHHAPCCGATTDCCASPVAGDFGPMPPASGPNPTMPPATPLTKR